MAGSLSGATVVPERTRSGATSRRPVGRAGKTRRAKLSVRRVDPWSVFVTSLLLSLLLAIVTMIASFVLYAVLAKLGVPKSINKTGDNIFDQQQLLTRGRFVGVAALIAGANVVLLTLLATIGAMLYNIVASFTGGLELTLGERD